MNIFNWLKSLLTSRGKAMSLYRRGMAKAERHDNEGALGDYTATIEMSTAPADVKAMAFYNRAISRVAIGDNQ